MKYRPPLATVGCDENTRRRAESGASTKHPGLCLRRCARSRRRSAVRQRSVVWSVRSDEGAARGVRLRPRRTRAAPWWRDKSTSIWMHSFPICEVILAAIIPDRWRKRRISPDHSYSSNLVFDFTYSAAISARRRRPESSSSGSKKVGVCRACTSFDA